VGLAKQLYPALSQATVLVIGAGDTAELVLRYLTQQPPARIMMVNRNQENAVALAARYPAEVMPFAALTTALTQADVVISATGSAVPVVTEGMMTDVLAKRSQSAITLIDIAVPRDIEAAVATLPGVTLRCIDDLKSIIQHNLRGREHAADKAQEVIAAKSKEFVAWLQSLDLVTLTIRAYRQQIEAISQAEMAKAARHLQRGDDPLQVLAAYAHAMTNKLLHTPSAQLRQAGVDGRVDILQIAQQLFAIPSSEAESA
jgi:glutamyl-tRNA reductase